MHRVLVVDDEESIRFSLKKFLSDDGYEVCTASHTTDAKAIIADNEFDVAIVDRILAGGGSGIDIVRHIRDAQPFCEPIMISAYPSFTSASENLIYETFAYLTKPIKKDELCQKVKEAVEKGITKKGSKHHERILQSIFDASPNAIIVYDLSGIVKFVNPSFSRIFGYEKEEVIGRLIPDILTDWEQNKMKSEITDLIAGKTVPERGTTRMTKDGQTVHITLTQSICKNVHEKPSNILAIIRDVTKRKQIENQLKQEQKMIGIGDLAKKIAYDIDNILMTIHANAEIAIDEMPDTNPRMKNMGIILKVVKQARNLTKQLTN